jgi:tRNA1(Val) A37 N6-methylase TrmN6
MYRPTLTKLICDKYDVEYVLDPCIGWGGRMLGVCANPGRKYIGFEPSTRMYDNLLKIVKFLGIEKQVTILNKGAENIPNVIKDKWIDLIITSPPYYNLEIYSDENTQSYTGQSYKDWLNNFFKKIVNFSLDVLRDGGYSCWNVADIHSNKKYRFVKDTENIHKERGFSLLEKFGIISSKRPTSNISSEKSLDTTYTFKQI